MVRFGEKLHNLPRSGPIEPNLRSRVSVGDKLGRVLLPTVPAVGPKESKHSPASGSMQAKTSKQKSSSVGDGQVFKRLDADQKRFQRKQRRQEKIPKAVTRPASRKKKKIKKKFDVKTLTSARALAQFWVVRSHDQVLRRNSYFERYLLRARKGLVIPRSHYRAERSEYRQY